MSKISACLVLKNEEKLISRCLDSIWGVVDEIIVVHDGECHDKTLEICKKYDAHIFVSHDYRNCNPHRAASFKKAQYDWILQIDADEFLSLELRNKIKDLVLDSSAAAYEFFWPIWHRGQYRTRNWPYKRCLFRRERFSFLGIPNYIPQIEGKIIRKKLLLEHRPIIDNFSWETFFKKLVPKAAIQASIYLQDFSKISKYNYQEKEWNRLVKIRLRFPLFMAPLEFIVTFYKNLINGAYQEGVFGWQVALIFGYYRFLIDWYIFKQKNNL